MSRIFLGLALSAMLFALCSFAEAQQPGKVPRIGYIGSSGSPSNLGPQLEAFRQGLRDLGYVEGKTIQIEYRYLEGKRDRIPSVVAELLQLKLDILVAGSPPVIRAIMQATKTMPIVIVTTQDPVTSGYVKSLARPGGNITGVTRLTRDLSGKRLELLTEAVPGISRVGLLSVTGPEVRGNALKQYEAAARTLKIPFQPLEVSVANPDLDGAFQAAAKRHVSAIITPSNFVLDPHRKKIADLAVKNRLPSMHEHSYYVEAGGLMSYTADEAESFRRAALYVDKILKGANPSDLPVEQPTKFELIINLKTAKQIGLTIPQSLLYRADKVIK